jgi:hypothetical protein
MKAKTVIGVMVVAAALLVPVAQAGGPDDRAGMRGPGAFDQADDVVLRPDDRAVHGVIVQQSTKEAAVRPDDRDGARGPGAIGSDAREVARPDDRAGVRGPGAITTVVVSSSTNSFDWGDALIGGLGGVGAALLLAGGLFVLMGQRSKTRVA